MCIKYPLEFAFHKRKRSSFHKASVTGVIPSIISNGEATCITLKVIQCVQLLSGWFPSADDDKLSLAQVRHLWLVTDKELLPGLLPPCLGVGFQVAALAIDATIASDAAREHLARGGLLHVEGRVEMLSAMPAVFAGESTQGTAGVHDDGHRLLRRPHQELCKVVGEGIDVSKEDRALHLIRRRWNAQRGDPMAQEAQSNEPVF